MKEPKKVLRLYVSDGANQELFAVLKESLENHLPGGYSLEVIDVLDKMGQAIEADIFATPTLMKVLPEPVMRVIGDLRDPKKTLVLLGVLEENV